MGLSMLCIYLLLMSSIHNLGISADKNETNTTSDEKKQIVVDIGLILDFNSSYGVMVNSCISMALSDFYSSNPHYITRLALHPEHSDDVLTATSAAAQLVNEKVVEAIIGPQSSGEARVVAQIGRKSQVPIISFSVTSSSLSPSQNPFFIRTTLPDSSQLEAITSLIQGLEWHEVVAIYEDNKDESGNGFITSLTDAFQQASIQLSYVIPISTSATTSHIKKELRYLRSMQTRVFLVHMTSPDLASRLFSFAQEVGMMGEGTAWIITDSLSNSLSSLDASTIESMEGILGIRPYLPKSKKLEDFKIKWDKNKLFLMQQPNYTENSSKLNIFGLRAYDTAWALATAVEKIQFNKTKSSYDRSNASCVTITNLRISEVGPKLVDQIMETRFEGLTGEFKLKHGELKTPVFEIINIVGNGETGDRTVGFWTQKRGFTRKAVVDADDNHKGVYSNSSNGLKPIIWPGDSTKKPKGWDVPGMRLKLKVGVPKKGGFKEFVDVEEIGDTKQYTVTGFSVDVFKAALHSLPFNLEAEFVPFMNDSGASNGTYDELVEKLSGTKIPRDYEAVVGDVTIRGKREGIVDFSLPYTESGVVMVVRAEPDKLKNMWIFLKPLSWDLWLTIVGAAIFIGIVLRILERRIDPQRQLQVLFWFPLAALAFPEKNMVGNNWARFVMVVWMFMAYILMQSYTANLSSILTVGQLTTSTDIPACAGYQQGSFVRDMLGKWMNISEHRSYPTMEAYDEALSKGCSRGGVDAIFDEIPYIRLFLHKYGSKYKMIGPTYSTGGFGFAFPTGSPLSKHVSMAILDVMEKGTIQEIEKRYFGVGYTSRYETDDIAGESPSLTTYSFAGLFTITAFLTLLALVCSECSFAISRYRGPKDGNNLSRVHSIEMTNAHASPEDLHENNNITPGDLNDDDENLGQEIRDEQVIQQHTISGGDG